MPAPDPARRRRKIRLWWIWGSISSVVIAVGIYLVFFVFAFHLIFVDEVVDEAGPVFASGASLDDADSGTDDAADPDDTDTTSDNQAGGVQTMARGNFMNRSHPTSGTAIVLSDGNETFLRFEDDFRTDNGPDLDVYLSSSPPDAPARAYGTDFINLGDMKGNIGAQNYVIPPGTDLSVYNTIVIWCVRFSVAFGTASLDLTPASTGDTDDGAAADPGSTDPGGSDSSTGDPDVQDSAASEPDTGDSTDVAEPDTADSDGTAPATTVRTPPTTATPTTAPPTPTTVPPTTTTPPTTTEPDTPQVRVAATGSFVPRGHNTGGQVVVLTDGSETFLRFEDDFRTSNGPDLDVYLSTSSNGDIGRNFINLGDLKGNIGSQNYRVPSGTDLTRYSTVVVWCVRFAYSFGSAALQTSAGE